MAHDVGHVTALANQAFRDLAAEELAMAAQGHPEANAWTSIQSGLTWKSVARHLHEFFAMPFAVYCQGPAFAYNVMLLHFNPV